MARDRVLSRDGRVILRLRDNPDGTVTLSKAQTVRPEHIMRMTGAPGWDQAHVDTAFESKKGNLRYTTEFVQYDIDIDTFRKYAFVKDVPPFGAQYHVDRKHYKSTGLRRAVSPTRDEDPVPEPPKHINFGEWLPCPTCKGQVKTPPCKNCRGMGYVPWKS